MSVLSTEQLGHAYHDNWLFKNLYVGLEKGDRVALSGINGTGKSTLLRILSDKLVPTEGKVVTERNLRIGYLEQDPQFNERQTIDDFIYSADNKQQQLVKEYEALSGDENPDENRLHHLINELTEQNAWDYEYQIKTILGRLGIQKFDQLISTLSGGQRKRLALAKLLIDEPDVYILDEPTNHLDIETIEWLESFLTAGNKTVLFVTHDRYFLDQVSSRIIELSNGALTQYKGNYSYYLEKKSEQDAATDAAYDKNKNLLKKELEWMRRQPKARSTKSKSRIDAFHDLKDKTKQRSVRQDLELGINMARQGGKILELKNIQKSFTNKPVVSNFSYTFKKGDKIGLTGSNGTGKSTLLNIVTGLIKPESGGVDVGNNTVFGYYKQSGLDADDSERVIDVVKNIAEYVQLANGKTLTASQFLTYFLFTPNIQYNTVGKLSGGERKRLQLMKVLMKNPNFLILDEPTNDLDIDTLNVLEDFLSNYQGVLLLVSHDRYFIDRLTDQLFVFEGDGNIKIYSGNYTGYRFSQDVKKSTPAGNKDLKIMDSGQSGKKLTFKKQKEIDELEKEVNELEAQVSVLTSTLNSGSSDHNKLRQISNEIRTLTAELEHKTSQWLEIAEK